MIPGDLLSAFPHRQFHTLLGLLDSWVALPNSNPNACMPMQGGSLYHFYDGLWYDPAERRTHDLPCERRTRYRLSQPDTVQSHWKILCTVTELFTPPSMQTQAPPVFLSTYVEHHTRSHKQQYSCLGSYPTKYHIPCLSHTIAILNYLEKFLS